MSARHEVVAGRRLGGALHDNGNAFYDAPVRLVRFAALGNSLHSFDRLPAGVTVENVCLLAEDGGESQGVLYTRGDATSVVCFMHPRGDQSRHWAMPALLEAGFAVFGHAGRYLLNDSDFVYEHILADVAAASVRLRERGYRHVIAVGNSGGGPLFAFYQAQALTAAAERLADTAAGEPCALRRLAMPPFDALVHLATHLGQGKLMLDNIDPSVLDESCELSCDGSLDMYDARNGYRVPPASSRYSAEFLTRYRTAQAERIRRIDHAARAMIDDNEYFLRLLEGPEACRLTTEARTFAERRAYANQYLQVHRTQAHPALLDLSVFPNRRQIGSFYSERPDICNYLAVGFGKWQTPRAWLSTWSVFASRASTLACLPRITVPTLVIAFTGDNMVFPGELEQIYEHSPAPDKALHYVDCDHFGMPLATAPGHGGRAEVDRILTAWLRARF